MSLGSSRRRWASRSSGMRLLPEGGRERAIGLCCSCDTGIVLIHVYDTAPISPLRPITSPAYSSIKLTRGSTPARLVNSLSSMLSYIRKEPMKGGGVKEESDRRLPSRVKGAAPPRQHVGWGGMIAIGPRGGYIRGQQRGSQTDPASMRLVTDPHLHEVGDTCHHAQRHDLVAAQQQLLEPAAVQCG